MTLGERIAKLRNDAGYSQEYIAEQLEVSRQAVSKWENDLSSPDTENLIKLSELLNTSVQFLATGKDFYFPEGKPAPEKKKIKIRLTKNQIKVLVSVLAVIILIVPICIGIFSSSDSDIKRYYDKEPDIAYVDFIAYKYEEKLSEMFLEEYGRDNFSCNGFDFYSLDAGYKERSLAMYGEAYLVSAAGNHYSCQIRVTEKRIWYDTYIWTDFDITSRISSSN